MTVLTDTSAQHRLTPAQYWICLCGIVWREALRFIHIRRRNEHAHLRSPRSDGVDQIPELAARQRIDAGGRLVKNKQIRIVDQRAA